MGGRCSLQSPFSHTTTHAYPSTTHPCPWPLPFLSQLLDDLNSESGVVDAVDKVALDFVYLGAAAFVARLVPHVKVLHPGPASPPPFPPHSPLPQPVDQPRVHFMQYRGNVSAERVRHAPAEAHSGGGRLAGGRCRTGCMLASTFVSPRPVAAVVAVDSDLHPPLLRPPSLPTRGHLRSTFRPSCDRTLAGSTQTPRGMW